MNALSRPLLLVLAVLACWASAPLPAAARKKPKVRITLVRLDPTEVPSAGQAALTVRVTGKGVRSVTADTQPAGGLPATPAVKLTRAPNGTYGGTLTAPENRTRAAVSVPVRVTASTRSGKKRTVVASLKVLPRGGGTPAPLLTLAYYHVRDSDGGAPGRGVDVVLAFEPGGVAQLYVCRADDAIARKGTYTYSGGSLSLRFTDDDFKPNVRFTLDTAQDQVSMPFKVFSGGTGASTWRRTKPSLMHQLNLLFKSISINEQLPTSQAIGRVVAYANAWKGTQVGASGGVRTAGLFDGLFDSKLTKVEPLANGVRLTWDNDPAVDVQLYSWANGSGVALQTSPLAGDPRVHLDPISPRDGSADPPQKTALFVAPFKTLQSFAWYDFYYLNKFTPIPSSQGYHLEGSFNFKFDAMEDVLEDRGYTVQRLEDAGASLVSIIRALVPGGGRTSAPGFLVFNTHGMSDGTLATGVLVGDDNGANGKLAAEFKALQEAGFGDLLTYDGGTANAPKTLDLMCIERDLKPGTHSYFISLTPKFWEWLRTKKGVDFSRSLVYMASCLTDKTPDLRNAVRARAYFAWNEPAVPELAGAIFQYLCTSLSRYSRTAEESYYNLIRVANTGQMIYKEDKLLDGFLYATASQQRNVLMNVFNGYGWDGGTLLRYQDGGWLKTPDANPGAIWWMLFAGRWGQNADGGWQALRRCWNEHWSKGSTGGLADPFCQNASPGRVPTQAEMGYTLYLLRGNNGGFPTPVKMPRWTLSDGD